MVYIYALVDPRDDRIRYVGKAKNLVRRLSDHIWEAQHGKPTWKNRWINTILAEGKRPLIISLEEVEEDAWPTREKYWIQRMRFLGCDLTNTAQGGNGGFPGRAAMEAVWEANRGRIASEETRAKMSEAKKGIPKSPAHIAAVKAALIGNPNCSSPGEKNVSAKLTEKNVVDIRELWDAGTSGKELAQMFNVTPANISLIVNRKAWTHI